MSCNVIKSVLLSPFVYIAGSFKPVHIGHWSLIERGIELEGTLHLFVSPKDRGAVKGITMKKIWENFLVPKMPPDTILHFSEKSPILDLLVKLKQADCSEDCRRHIILTESKDIDRYSVKELAKFAPRLVKESLIEVREVNRASTYGGISGTMMRMWLETRNTKQFIENLPSVLSRKERREVLQLLQNQKR